MASTSIQDSADMLALFLFLFYYIIIIKNKMGGGGGGGGGGEWREYLRCHSNLARWWSVLSSIFF